MTIRMYNCGFGDSFRIIGNDDNNLLVDMGIHNGSMSQSNRYSRYDDIGQDIPDRCDFLLTHFHSDHYEGVLYLSRKGIHFDNVYLPDIFQIRSSIKVLYLHLLHGLLTKFLIDENNTLIDFLQAICKTKGKIYFVSRGDNIQNDFVALWPSEDYLEAKASKFDLSRNEENRASSNKLWEIAEKVRNIALQIGETYEAYNRQDIETELRLVGAEYKELASQFGGSKNLQYKLKEFGNDISIVFQNNDNLDFNLLFTGDFGRKSGWRLIETNSDGKIDIRENFEVIKIPHHGTSRYYKTFRNYICQDTNLMIPNGQISRRTGWFIDNRYSIDAQSANSSVVCTDNQACNACAGRCVCTRSRLVSTTGTYIDI